MKKKNKKEPKYIEERDYTKEKILKKKGLI